MFESIKKAITNRHIHTQKAIYNTIITTRKVNKHIRKEATTLSNDTKTTWKDAMSADIS